MNELVTEGSYWPTRAQELLLQAACFTGAAARAAWLEWQEKMDFDLIDGGSQRLIPLLYQNLLRAGLDGPDLGRCKGLYRRAWYTNQILFHHLEGVLRTLNDAGIPTMLLGGAALVVHYYRDHGTRPMDRGNIHVPRDQAARAVSLLRQSGWTVVGHFPRCQAWEFLGPADQRLTLHGQVPHEIAASRTEDDVWDAATPVLVRQVSTRVLDPTRQILDTCASGILWSPLPAMCWAADVLVIVRSAGAEIDWKRLVTRAEQCRISLPVRAVLGYVQRQLAAAVPLPALSALEGIPVGFPERMLFQARTTGGLSAAQVVRIWSREMIDGAAPRPGHWIALARCFQDLWSVSKPWQLPGHVLVRAARKLGSRSGPRAGAETA